MMALRFYERETSTGNSPKQICIFLHGYGSNGTDLISLAPEFYEILPDCYFVSPDAPYPFEGMMFNSFQWYGLMDRSDVAMLNGAKKAEPILNEFIDQQLKRFKLSDENLIVMGFSQGGMMAIHTMLRRLKPCKAVISFSGFIAGAENLMHELASKPPVLLTHGTHDAVVPYAAQDASFLVLSEMGIKVFKHSSEGLGHGIDYECISAAKDFVKKLI